MIVISQKKSRLSRLPFKIPHFPITLVTLNAVGTSQFDRAAVERRLEQLKSLAKAKGKSSLMEKKKIGGGTSKEVTFTPAEENVEK